MFTRLFIHFLARIGEPKLGLPINLTRELPRAF